MPLLLKDATKFALRQKRQRSEDNKGSDVYPVRINDESYGFQLVPFDSVDVQVAVEPLTFSDREGMRVVYLIITEDIYNELLKVETGCSELLAEKRPGAIWQSALRPPSDKYRATLKVKFYQNVQIYDEKHEKIEAPKFWRNAFVTPILNIKVWVNENGAGLCFNLAAVKISKPKPRTYSFV